MLVISNNDAESYSKNVFYFTVSLILLIIRLPYNTFSRSGFTHPKTGTNFFDYIFALFVTTVFCEPVLFTITANKNFRKISAPKETALIRRAIGNIEENTCLEFYETDPYDRDVIHFHKTTRN